MQLLSAIKSQPAVKNLVSFLVIIALFLTGTTSPIVAQGGQPLPALPDRSILDKIVKDTGGPTLTPLGVPMAISNQFLSMALQLNPALIKGNNLTAEKIFDLPHAVYYASLDGGLKRILLPMIGLAEAQLAPNMQTSDGAPAFMLGGSFEFGTGPQILIVVWKDNNAKKPSELKVYTTVNGKMEVTTPYKLIYRKFKGNKDSKVAPGDQGIVIAARETCFSVGMDQICYAAEKQDKQAEPKAASAINDAVTALSKAYDFKAKIDVDGALPEIAGSNWRKQCAAKLAQTTAIPAMQTLAECATTMAFAGVNDVQSGQPIGAIHLFKDIEQPAYDMAGNSVGKVLAGNYLILDATPDITDPGAPGVLMLVNADGKTNFLIPSQAVEGFGESDDAANNSRKGQAGIKDATVGAHVF